MYSPHTLSFTRCAAVARLEHLLGWTGKYLHRRRTLDKDAWSRTVRPSRCSGRHLMNAAWRHLHVGRWVVEGRRVPSYHALGCGSTRLLIDHVRTMCYSCRYDRVDCLLTICATAPTLNTITVLHAHSNLVVPRCILSTYGNRAFSVAGPVCWNALLDYLKSSDLSFNVSKHQLKHFYFVDTDTSTTVAH